MIDELPNGLTAGTLALALAILALWIVTLLVIRHDKKHNQH